MDARSAVLMLELHAGEKSVGKYGYDRLLQRQLYDCRKGDWIIKTENCMEEEKASRESQLFVLKIQSTEAAGAASSTRLSKS